MSVPYGLLAQNLAITNQPWQQITELINVIMKFRCCSFVTNKTVLSTVNYSITDTTFYLTWYPIKNPFSNGEFGSTGLHKKSAVDEVTGFERSS